jgi:hypothetical protein
MAGKHDFKSQNTLYPNAIALPRWWWIVIFALSLGGLAKFGYAQDFHSLSPVPILHTQSLQLDAIYPGSLEPVIPTSRAVGPRSAHITAELVNLDGDSEADGWVALLMLRNRDGQPVITRATATFELHPSWIGTDEYSFIPGTSVIDKWTVPLNFDDRGIARVELPARTTINRGRISHRPRDFSYRGHRFADLGDGWVHPMFGPQWLASLNVRVSAPTYGTYDAVSIVPMLQSVHRWQ